MFHSQWDGHSHFEFRLDWHWALVMEKQMGSDETIRHCDYKALPNRCTASDHLPLLAKFEVVPVHTEPAL